MNHTELNTKDVSDFHDVLARSATALRGYSGMEHALAHGHLSTRQREEIALAVAEINGSARCVAAHSAIAREIGMTSEDIRLARSAAAFDPESRALLAFTLMVVLQRGEIKPHDLKSLLEAGFSEADVVEIVANIALNIFANYLNLIARTEASMPQMTGAVRQLAGKEL